MSLNWVEHSNYVGPDRRKRAPAVRLLERRRQSYVTDPPTLMNALRRLKLKVLDVVDEESVAEFATLTGAVQQLAMHKGRPDIGGILEELHCTLCGPDVLETDPRIVIEFTLAACADILVQCPQRFSDGKGDRQRN